jgi:prepilin-type N-terminal cleavage/methylation domain-containing protein
MKKQKRAVTLMEVMIVVVLIGIITSVIGVNMKKSLDEGKAFKTERAKEQIQDAVLYHVATSDQYTLQQIVDDEEILKEVLSASPLIKDSSSFLKDGWGEKFQIKLKRDKHEISVESINLNRYNEKKKKKKENNERPSE